MFHVGQMVVAVEFDGPESDDPEWRKILDGMPDLDRGRIYTIRDIDGRPRIPHVRLEEIIGPVVQTYVGPFEIGYHPDSFRPVKTTSIEIFRQLVANPKDKVRA